METKTHVFELAGLGKAPFQVAGFEIRKYQACPGAPMQPGTSCDYCGTGIMNVFIIKGSDGRLFKVGCDCVAKTGDNGLRKEVNAVIRTHRKQKRDVERVERNRLFKVARYARVAADRDQTLKEHPGLAEAFECDHEIIQDIKEKLYLYGTLSAAQIALVIRLAEQAKAPKAKAPTGRVTIRGEVIKRKTVENEYGAQAKMIVKVETAEGAWFAYGTVPQALFEAARGDFGRQLEVGAQVEFSALLKPGNEPHFAFYSRPTKAVLLDPGPKQKDA